jgi:hypothetical protein
VRYLPSGADDFKSAGCNQEASGKLRVREITDTLNFYFDKANLLMFKKTSTARFVLWVVLALAVIACVALYFAVAH